MTMFDFIVNIVEALSIALIIATSIKKDYIYILIQTVIISLVTTFYNYDNVTFILLILMTVCSLLVSYIFNKSLSLKVVNQVLLAFLVDVFCNLIALLTISLLSSELITNISIINQMFIYAIIFARIMNLLIALLIYHKRIVFNLGNFSLIMTFILGILNIIINTLNDAIVYEVLNLQSIYMLSFSFVLFSLLLVVLIILLARDNEKRIEEQIIQEQAAITKSNLILIDSISKKITDTEHMLNYILIKLKYLIEKEQKEDAIQLINSETWKLKKLNHYINTKNPYFDRLLSAILKKYHDKNINPIVMCEIGENEMDKNLKYFSHIVNLLNDISTCVNASNKMKIEFRSTTEICSIFMTLSDLNDEQISYINNKSNDICTNYINYSYYRTNTNIVEFRYLIGNKNNERNYS